MWSIEMNVIGVAESHGSSACLMLQGQIVGLLQEERLTKRKNQVAFPRLAIEALISEHLNGDPTRIDRVVLAEHWIDPYAIALDRHAEYSVLQHVKEQHDLWRPYFYGGDVNLGAYWTEKFLAGESLNSDHGYDFTFLKEMEWEEVTNHFSQVKRQEAFQTHFGWAGEFTNVDHHTCHAYYAAYGSPLSASERRDALVLTADAWGEDRNWSAWIVKDSGELECVDSGQDHIVARIYKFVTLILGMKPNEHEFKVMGLAPYSKSTRHILEAEAVFNGVLDFRDGAFVSDDPLKRVIF